MRSFFKYMIVLLCLFYIQSGWAQNGSKSICRVEDGKLFFLIDLKWDREQQIKIVKQFDIDSLVMDKVFKGQTKFIIKNETWSVRKISTSIVELSKPLDSKGSSFVSKNNVILLDDGIKLPTHSGAIFTDYGVNKLDLKSAFKYIEGVAIFYLPNKKSAQTVFLSGSFNDWSTTQIPMHRSDSGWIAKIKLQPGKYYYKYIVDGKWTNDPNNRIKERDGNWGYNSIIYCYNYQFKLSGMNNSQRVTVAGSFNHWDPNELQMGKSTDGWILPLFLREGTHAYKFIVDNRWITDPANKVTHSDGRGNINSFIGIGSEYLFKLQGYTTASRVVLSGTFNAWNQGELEMEKVQGGWQLPYNLGAGNYDYRFIVNGRWVNDPQNPYTNGSGDYTNSFLAFKATHTFVLNKFLDAKSVIVTGSFNGWSRSDYRMVKKNGKWVFPIYLKPGKYTYKFIVDGSWITDPDNKIWENNEFNTGNSVLWIEQ